MKKFLIRYKDNYFSQTWKFMIVIAETSQDTNNFFFDNYSGTIFRTEFIGWASEV